MERSITLRKNKRRPVIAAVAAAAVCGMLMVHSEAASEAVGRGIAICGGSVIPSLFPMMFLSQYIVRSGAAEPAGELLECPVRLLFGLPGVCGVALLTAFIGGYPAGARAAETLVAEGRITRREGERLAQIAFCAGPGFAVGMIGGALYKNKSVGLLILTAQALSCIIIGIAYRLLDGTEPSAATGRSDNASASPSASDAFVQSAVSTASTMLNMCSFIVVFQVIVALLDRSGVNDALGWLTAAAGWGEIGKMLLPCIVEVTGGCILSVSGGILLTAFVAGFGGLSVHFQNFAICRAIRPNKALYCLTRTIQGALCSFLAWLGLKLPCFSDAVQTASGMVVSGIPVGFSRVSVGFGCAMLVMCLMSVICLPQERERI